MEAGTDRRKEGARLAGFGLPTFFLIRDREPCKSATAGKLYTYTNLDLCAIGPRFVKEVVVGWPTRRQRLMNFWGG